MRNETLPETGSPVVVTLPGQSPVEAAIASIANIIKKGYCTVSLFSGGKDSSVVTVLALEAIRRLKAEGYLLATHYVSSSSTGLDNPEIEHNLLDLHAAIEAFVARHDLPVQVKMVYDREFPVDGLRDYSAECWNPYRHPERADAHRDHNGERLVWFESDKRLGVDAAAAMLFIEDLRDSDFIIRARLHSAIDSARFWLNEGIVTLPQGLIAKYQEMAKRGQYFSRFIDVENLTPAQVDAHLMANSISEKEHASLVAALGESAKRPSMRPVHRREPEELPPLGGLFAGLDEPEVELPVEIELQV